jgi:GNAT superfamily N-acetyltransferase
MFVIASERRRGFGFRLLDELETGARNHGITRLELDTRDERRRYIGEIGERRSGVGI